MLWRPCLYLFCGERGGGREGSALSALSASSALRPRRCAASPANRLTSADAKPLLSPLNRFKFDSWRPTPDRHRVAIVLYQTQLGKTTGSGEEGPAAAPPDVSHTEGGEVSAVATAGGSGCDGEGGEQQCVEGEGEQGGEGGEGAVREAASGEDEQAEVGEGSEGGETAAEGATARAADGAGGMEVDGSREGDAGQAGFEAKGVAAGGGEGAAEEGVRAAYGVKTRRAAAVGSGGDV